ncbi:MAG TPA: cell envelope integrity protein CreD [Saprospiraceae bacterium]|nr:cell envelope integrity protein CreD [Saprospiraceae bacterium]
MTTTSFFQNSSIKITLKLALIFFLTLFLLIPKFMILDLVQERQKLSESVTNEVAKGWGNKQTHTGPALVIPYFHYIQEEDKTKPPVKTKTQLIVFPETLSVDGQIETESKYRSLYKVLLYKTGLKVKGNFKLPDATLTNIKTEDLLLGEASIIMGVSDPKGINAEISLNWNGKPATLNPGKNDIYFTVNQTNENLKEEFVTNYDYDSPQINTGLQAQIALDATTQNYEFSYNLDLRGSKALLFAPLAKSNSVHLDSEFPDPVFYGGFLPDHKTDNKGFDANWNIFEYNKSIPAFIKDNSFISIGDNLFGVEIRVLIDNYAKTYRAGKYMILFVILTFLVVFLTEIVEKINIHIFQYTLIGLALAIFFTLLLSISEFWGFDLAYTGAASATIGLIFLYSLGMFRNKKSSGLLLGLMVALFAYIYIIIQLEKTALLAGSIGLFVIIAMTMYVTRKIKWFEESETNQIGNENLN